MAQEILLEKVYISERWKLLEREMGLCNDDEKNRSDVQKRKKIHGSRRAKKYTLYLINHKIPCPVKLK
jgi:hypothetical protein